MRQLPAYTADGQLILPKNFQKWVFVGSPLTPNLLNHGKANFPEFHNVYIEPASYDIYKKTGVFPEGTIFLKELQLILGPNEFPDGSRTEPSGRGFFPGKFNGADVTVKDSKRYAATGGWGYYNFNHHEPKAPTAKLDDVLVKACTAQKIGDCALCALGADIPVNSVGRTLRVFIHDPTCCEFLKLVRTPHRAAGSHQTPTGTALFPAANAFMTPKNWSRPALDATIGFSTFTPPDEPNRFTLCATLF